MSDSSFSKGFLLGALIGAGIVFFMGTKKGQELRDELLERGEEFLDQAEKILAGQDMGGDMPDQAPRRAAVVKHEDISVEDEESELSEEVMVQQTPLQTVESIETFAHLQVLQEQGRQFGRFAKLTAGKRFFHRKAKAA